MPKLISQAEQWWTVHAARFLRYSGVSVFNVVFGQFLLLIMHSWLGIVAWVANLVAVTIGSIPAFFFAKRFVWRNPGRVRFRSELLPFGLMNLTGLVLSTAAVALVDGATNNALAVQLASLTAWGGLWVVKYAFLGRILAQSGAQAEQAAVSAH